MHRPVSVVLDIPQEGLIRRYFRPQHIMCDFAIKRSLNRFRLGDCSQSHYPDESSLSPIHAQAYGRRCGILFRQMQ